MAPKWVLSEKTLSLPWDQFNERIKGKKEETQKRYIREKKRWERGGKPLPRKKKEGKRRLLSEKTLSLPWRDFYEKIKDKPSSTQKRYISEKVKFEREHSRILRHVFTDQDFEIYTKEEGFNADYFIFLRKAASKIKPHPNSFYSFTLKANVSQHGSSEIMHFRTPLFLSTKKAAEALERILRSFVMKGTESKIFVDSIANLRTALYEVPKTYRYKGLARREAHSA